VGVLDCCLRPIAERAMAEKAGLRRTGSAGVDTGGSIGPVHWHQSFGCLKGVDESVSWGIRYAAFDSLCNTERI
jgi:hypothetical protein